MNNCKDAKFSKNTLPPLGTKQNLKINLNKMYLLNNTE